MLCGHTLSSHQCGASDYAVIHKVVAALKH